MRISEAMRLRVKDIDFANKQIEIRDSKFGKSRLVPMPDNLIAPLERWVASREILHRHDVAEGIASVWLPFALDRKYPSAHQELLGHNDVKTTEICTHVRNPQESGLVSPLDRLLGTVSA